MADKVQLKGTFGSIDYKREHGTRKRRRAKQWRLSRAPAITWLTGVPNVSDRSIEEAMDKEAASCPTMAAEQIPGGNMADGRTNEKAGEQRKANIRKRMALEKEEQEAKMEVRK